ncbi:conserved hypothetical protein [Methanosalsum zhilinae DSM 4017]|uniref:Lysylphosphatidylglycerol synthetase/UPF0104 n=1 Tax=Methanosalsum zhilinae (strain DSM 4017 / NBRC 107636 / OCM 62 / WeN5) TaxID=679901 RepID=F7XKK8_METZD|nr:conserved hypothetical protein [Methanosalsum zhilinae DSM 4017]
MNRFAKLVLASILISILSIVLILIITVDATTIESIMQVKPEYLLLAALIHVLSYVIWGLRTKFMCSALDHDINLIKTVEIIASGAFAASFTPSSVGGEPVRIHLLHKNNIPLGKSTAVVLGERLMDAALIISAVPFALYVFGDLLSNSRVDTFLIFAVLFSFSILFLLIYAIWKPWQTRRLLHYIVNRIARLTGKKADTISRVLKRVDSELDHFHNSIWLFLTDGKIGLFYGVFFTIAYWVFQFSILPLILIGLNLNPSVVAAYAAQVLVTIISIASMTPGSSGVVEIGATPIFALFVSSSMVGVVVVVWRAITFYMNIIIGGFVSIKILKDTDIINRLLE